MKRKNKSKKSLLSVQWPIFLIGGMIVLVSAAVYISFRATLPQSKTEVAEIPPYFQRIDDARPFPATLAPDRFKQSQVRKAYEIAKAMPNVLAQQPCYCYCKRKGHRSLLDCFANDHASDCDICVREAIFAGQEREKGKSPEEIRDEIMNGAWKSIQVTN